jgi:sigma-B regulation protein RsbU (phosphoserine phosphatase)
MLPKLGSGFANLDFAAEWVPAAEVGGDFYDAFPTKGQGFAIVVGDVSGKSLPAAVIVGLILGAVRTSHWMSGSVAHETATRNLSDLLRARTASDRFASLFWCYYDPTNQVLRFVNCGHPPPIIVRRRTGGALEIERMEEGGPILGIVPSGEYRQGAAPFKAGDLLVLYSDGVLEAERADLEQFGAQRILEAITDNVDKSCSEIRQNVLERVHAFVQENPANDDLTLVVARLLP